MKSAGPLSHIYILSLYYLYAFHLSFILNFREPKKLEGIFLNLSNLQEINFTSEGFARMNKLRLLKVYTSQKGEV